MAINKEAEALIHLLESMACETDRLTDKCLKERPEAVDLEMQRYTLVSLIQSTEALKHSLSIMNSSRLPKEPDLTDELFGLAKVCCTAARSLRVLVLKYCEENGFDLSVLRRLTDQDIQRARIVNSLADMDAYETIYREMYPETPADMPLVSILYDGKDPDNLN